MSKGVNSIYIRVLSFVICLIITGITGTICAQDTVAASTPFDTTMADNGSTPLNDRIIVSSGNSTHFDDSITVSVSDAIHYPDSIHTSTLNDSIHTVTGIDESAADSISAEFNSIFINNDNNYFSNFDDSSGIIITTDNIRGLTNNSTFKPNPKLATRVALIFPGFGQAYNRQYWKLPLVYGGLMGFMYAITWNNKTYQDYKDAYFDIVQDSKNDPKSEKPETWSQSWQDFLSGDPASRLHDRNFHDNLKRGKDYFRRYRDLSIILGVAFYFICVADAYVDAQMFDFDISPDLSFRFTPIYIPETIVSSRCYGINMCMTF